MKANEKASELRNKLFNLVNEFKSLHLSVLSHDEAAAQADAVACELARVYDSISGPSAERDLFIDLARDSSDQSFAFDTN